MNTTLTPKISSLLERARTRRARFVVAIALAAASMFAVATPASATTFSPYVNTYQSSIGGQAWDCTVKVGAFYRADRKAQGAGDIFCSARHAQLVLDVQLQRWNGSAWVNASSTTRYTYNNSTATSGNQVTLPVSTCGLAYWRTVGTAWVLTGSTWNDYTVWNAAQQYDPCA